MSIIPFALLLVVFALLDGRVVLAVWTFAFLGMPTMRSRFGPVSVYWCDVAALSACLVCMRWPGTEANRYTSKWYVGLAAVHLLGVATSLVRYDAILEPGYEALRYGIAFLPLLLLPRIANDDRVMAWFWHGVLAAALWMAALALIQTFWRELAFQIGTFLYGVRSGVGFAYHERVLLDGNRVRAYGMYSASTCFAGAASMVGALLMLRISQMRAGLLARLGLLGTAVTMLLTFSRHGLIAWAVLLLPSFLRNPRRGAALPVLLVILVGALGAGEFWIERINRGGVRDDENLSSRLIDRPLELRDRISEEPSILLTGVGLGTDHMASLDREDGPSRLGFVSNGFALYLFYMGLAGLGVVVALLAMSLRAAWRLEADMRAAAIGGLGATVVVIASDNYAFMHSSFPFMWSVLVALIHSYADAPDEYSEVEEHVGVTLPTG